MERVDFSKEKIPFTQVANSVLCSTEISAKAKCLYAYLYSKPDGWDFAIDRIAKDMKEGRKSINAGLQELEMFGFLKRSKQSTGRVAYKVYLPTEKPDAQRGHLAKKPDAQNGKVPKRQSAKTGTISNTEFRIIKNKTSNTDNTSKAVALQDKVQDLIELFKPINPYYDKIYKNTTQRKSLKSLVDRFGVDKVKNMLLSLPDIVSMPYAPKISTPLELERDLGKLIIFIKQNNSIKSEKVGNIAFH